MSTGAGGQQTCLSGRQAARWIHVLKPAGVSCPSPSRASFLHRQPCDPAVVGAPHPLQPGDAVSGQTDSEKTESTQTDTKTSSELSLCEIIRANIRCCSRERTPQTDAETVPGHRCGGGATE